MAHYLFNARDQHEANGSVPKNLAAEALRLNVWSIGPAEPHRDALAPGDLVLVYLSAPQRVFLGAAELASAVHEWPSSWAHAYPGDSTSGVSLTHVEDWDPPVPMHAVLARIGPSEQAKADFDSGVVVITAFEYDCALAVAAESTDRGTGPDTGEGRTEL